MVMQLAVFVFAMAITFIQSIYGLFSGVIMTFCSIVAAAVALGCYEALDDVTVKFIHPSYSSAASLVILFVVTLLLLRVLADNLIRGNVRVPAYLDWGGGGVLGFITAQLCMGILVIGFQMLPFGGRVMMYQMYEPAEGGGSGKRAEFTRNRLWLNPDGFTAGLVSALSNGSLRGSTTLASVYPDFPQWVFFTGNTVQKESFTAPARDSGDGTKAVKVLQWWDAKEVEGRYRTKAPTRQDDKGQYEAQIFKPETGMKLIGMRLELGKLAGDRTSSGSVSHRFRPTMIRLVGAAGDTPQHYPAKVLSNVDPKIDGKPRIADMDSNFNADAQDLKLDVYFEVEQDFKPAFVEYRRFARASVTDANLSKTAATGSLEVAKTPEQVAQQASGQFRFVDYVDRERSGDREDLPFNMALQRVSTAPDAQLEGNMFVSGRISGEVAGFRDVPGGGKVDKFKVPENKRIVQIAYSPVKAASTFGQVFNYVARTVNQYSAVDDKGDTHRLAGYYAIVKRGTEQHFELFFTGDPESPTFRGMLDFQEIKPNELTAPASDAQLGLIFIVPKGVKIIEVKNQLGQGVKELDFQANR